MSEHFGARAYVLEGWVAAVKGALAFLATPALGSLSDLAGATTKNKVSGYGQGFPGHSDSYYKRSPYAQGTEAFANITSLMGHALSFWHEVARRVAPNQVREWEQLIEQEGGENG